MWKHLTHPNILPLLGVTIDGFQLVSNWISGGHLLGYIQKNSDADRLGLVGVPPLCLSHTYSHYQLSDVADGLCYLHSCNCIHGDLKGVRDRSTLRFPTILTPHQLNILVDDSGHALITDFGLSTVARNLSSILSSPPRRGHTKRWAAPEILDDGPNSKEGDIFAFAMVMIEVRHRRTIVCGALAYRHFVLT
jgi:serine/threonine protein kinase